MNEYDIQYHLYDRPKNLQTEAEHERLVSRLVRTIRERKRKPKQPHTAL